MRRAIVRLEALDDHTLKDIGIHRCQIQSVMRMGIFTGIFEARKLPSRAREPRKTRPTYLVSTGLEALHGYPAPETSPTDYDTPATFQNRTPPAGALGTHRLINISTGTYPPISG
jgi:hypothetical protein